MSPASPLTTPHTTTPSRRPQLPAPPGAAGVLLGCVVRRASARYHTLTWHPPPAGSNALRPWQQLELLQEELEAYSPALVELPALVIANKTDLLPEPAASLAELRRRTELPVVGVSAREGTGLGPLVKALAELVPVGRLGDS